MSKRDSRFASAVVAFAIEGVASRVRRTLSTRLCGLCQLSHHQAVVDQQTRRIAGHDGGAIPSAHPQFAARLNRLLQQNLPNPGIAYSMQTNAAPRRLQIPNSVIKLRSVNAGLD